MPQSDPARIVVVMGVSSSGKSTVGAGLSKSLGVPFLDGDGYHPPENVEKMRAGTPLTDEDRWPWLERLSQALAASAGKNGAVVGACSALKRSYRDFITEKAGEPVLFVHLHGTRELLAERIAARHHEYMPASLLDSQIATLEVPAPDENALIVPIEPPVEEIVRQIRAQSRIAPARPS